MSILIKTSPTRKASASVGWEEFGGSTARNLEGTGCAGSGERDSSGKGEQTSFSCTPDLKVVSTGRGDYTLLGEEGTGIFCFSLFFFFSFFRVALSAYGGSQARDLIGASAASLHHSHSHARSELRR